ncbi:MAG TPA: cyclic nucleotide-binding domain-containing protein, partial [Candidatus Polarisedimenticolia bacterium]|nr:cyclic nucleotide-binding domain-containing protein [Candidatus Polarisedimenticolia bacterium]
MTPETFPVLEGSQLERATAGSPIRTYAQGEVLIEPGQIPRGIFVVLDGQVDLFRVSDREATWITTLEAGQFSGEVGTLAGRPSLGRFVARTPAR